MIVFCVACVLCGVEQGNDCNCVLCDLWSVFCVPQTTEMKKHAYVLWACVLCATEDGKKGTPIIIVFCVPQNTGIVGFKINL